MTIQNKEALNNRVEAYTTLPRDLEKKKIDDLLPARRTFMKTLYELDGSRYVLKQNVPQPSRQQVFRALEYLDVLNGIRLVLVRIKPDRAELEVHFFNLNHLAEMNTKANAQAKAARDIFRISGGHRVLAGRADDRVHVESVSFPNLAEPVLHLDVKPIGDYSTYTLSIMGLALGVAKPLLDPLFSEIDFKFRPACFNNCPPDWDSPPKPKEDPAINYLAKDYDTFRHTMIARMMERVPDWAPTSEADFDQVLLELFSASADELSDYQDRVVNEAYLATARKRVSLARHARLMDYHIHQGNQASTWLALKVIQHHKIEKDFIAANQRHKIIEMENKIVMDSQTLKIKEDTVVWSDRISKDAGKVCFKSRQRDGDQPQVIQPLTVDPLVNELSLYTWSDTAPALAKGSLQADLEIPGGKTDALAVQKLFAKDGPILRLLVQEHLNPSTGRPPGRDVTRRQLLKLIKEGVHAPQVLEDPVTGTWFVRVHWEEQDRLKRDYCFTVDCDVGKQDNVSLFHGNLVEIYHGEPQQTLFEPPSARIGSANRHYYERNRRSVVICRIPERELAFQARPSGGDIEPRSTVELKIRQIGREDPWEEVISLVRSDGSDERGDHFVVEIDETGRSLIRFGDGVNGQRIPSGSVVQCDYQVGNGLEGNIGADTLHYFDSGKFSGVDVCWNPFDITNGQAPEPFEEIRRRTPEAFRHRQLRAVTLQDYVDRAEELPEVDKAAAKYLWTGSWRTVRVAVDPVGTPLLKPELLEKLTNHLEAVRLIGEDLEIRPPRFIPLDISVAVCVDEDYWPQDVEFILEQEFSEGFTGAGREGFFHPDMWTFGQELHESEVIGRVQSIHGVDHVIGVSMKRWNETTPETLGVLEVQANEIIQVKNDPDHMERGFIKFDLQGGRQ